jgi:hypothetical protein
MRTKIIIGWTALILGVGILIRMAYLSFNDKQLDDFSPGIALILCILGIVLIKKANSE